MIEYIVKILVIGKYYSPYSGGIEESTRLICERLAKSFYVKALVFNHASGNVIENLGGVEVDRRHVQAVISSQPISASYAAQIFREDADVIYFHAPNVFACLLVLCRYAFRRRQPHLVILHHMDIFGRPFLRPFARLLYNRLIRRAEAVVVTSHKNAAVSGDIRTPAKIVAIPLGIDPDHYRIDPVQRETALAWRQSLVGDAPLIGFVGRIVRYKGIAVLVEAMARLPGVHAVIAGDGPERRRCEALAVRLGIADRVHFLGLVSHERKCAILSAIDVFAFPSTEITEAFGISQVEAMMIGAPVVASDLPTGVTDVSIDGETALLTPPGDPIQLAATLRRMIDDRELARRLADRARERALQHFTTEAMGSRNEAFMKALVGQDTAEPALQDATLERSLV